jgi:hypothetical protein
LPIEGCRSHMAFLPERRRVTKSNASGTVWKVRPQWVIVLYAKVFDLSRDHLSTAGHVKSGGKLGRPLPEAKYYLATDSEPVP